jgi:hypothetical protein
MEVVDAPDRAAMEAAVAAETRADYVARFGAALPDAIVAAAMS